MYLKITQNAAASVKFPAPTPFYAKKKMRNTNENSTKSEGQISLGVALQRPAWIGNLRRDTWLLARCPMGTQHPPLKSGVAKIIERS